MEIRIDTKKDSVDDIKKVIRFLQNFINEHSYGTNYDSMESTPDVNEGIFNIFNDDSDDDYTNPLTDDDEDEGDDVRIVPY